MLSGFRGSRRCSSQNGLSNMAEPVCRTHRKRRENTRKKKRKEKHKNDKPKLNKKVRTLQRPTPKKRLRKKSKEKKKTREKRMLLHKHLLPGISPIQHSPIMAKRSISDTARPDPQVALSKPIQREGKKVYRTHWIARADTKAVNSNKVSPLAIQ